MANVLVDENSLSSIGNAIREKNGTTTTYKPAEMAAAISAIQSGGSGGFLSVDNPITIVSAKDSSTYLYTNSYDFSNYITNETPYIFVTGLLENNKDIYISFVVTNNIFSHGGVIFCNYYTNDSLSSNPARLTTTFGLNGTSYGPYVTVDFSGKIAAKWGDQGGKESYKYPLSTTGYLYLLE